MRGNILKAASKGQELIKVNPAYDINGADISALIKSGADLGGVITAIANAYYGGIEIGRRLAGKEAKK